MGAYEERRGHQDFDSWSTGLNGEFYDFLVTREMIRARRISLSLNKSKFLLSNAIVNRLEHRVHHSKPAMIHKYPTQSSSDQKTVEEGVVRKILQHAPIQRLIVLSQE